MVLTEDSRRLADDFERLIRRMVPHLRCEVRAADHRLETYVSWSREELQPDGRRTYDADTMLTVVLSTGEGAYCDLEARVQSTSAARLFWGELNLRDMVHRALQQLADGGAARAAADALARELGGEPPSWVLVFPVQGIAPDPPVLAGGVTFCFRDPELLAPLLEQPADRVRTAIWRERLPFNRDGVAITEIAGDYARAPLNARERIMVAMSILACVRAGEQHISGETDFAFGDTEWGHVFFVQPYGGIGSLYPQDVEQRQFWIGNEVVAGELARRRGLQELNQLAKSLPVDVRAVNEIDRRLLRACVMIATSFSGTPAERVLKRWVAIESLVGDRDGEASERIADRLAVLAVSPAERAARKNRIKQLYRYRNDVAHGREVREIPSDEAGEIRGLALTSLERTAELRSLATDRALFERLEVARYEAGWADAARVETARRRSRATEE